MGYFGATMTYGNKGSNSSKHNNEGKVYLEKKEFLSEDTDDRTTVTAIVRRYEYGGATGELTIMPGASMYGGDNRGINISCSPTDIDSRKKAIEKVDNLVKCLQEFKKALNEVG